jgi:beta-barrel assembly-enhancing protease
MIGTNGLPMFLALALAATLSVEAGLASPLQSAKRSRADKNIDAIGHRRIARGINLYSPEKEEERGKALSEQVEHSAKMLPDPTINAYVGRVAQNVAQNSDSEIPIQVRMIDSEEVNACTLPGGYLYVTVGLLLQLESEGELASVLARGIAHTALRSAARLATRAYLLQATMQGAASRFVALSQLEMCETGNSSGNYFMLLTWRRYDELDADYFGVQYVYKAGYDPETFIRLVQHVWSMDSAPGVRNTVALSPFPPVPQRLKALWKEIADLLPRREGTVVSTPEFEEFREHLRALKPRKAIW